MALAAPLAAHRYNRGLDKLAPTELRVQAASCDVD